MTKLQLSHNDDVITFKMLLLLELLADLDNLLTQTSSMLCVRTLHTDSWFRRYHASDDVMKTKQDTGLISIEDV